MSDKINKVVILVPTAFNTRDYTRFGVDILLKNGFDVHVIDVSPLLYPKFYERLIIDVVEYPNHRCVRSISDVNNELKNFTRRSFIISILPFGPNVYKIFRLISKYSIPYAIMAFQAVVFEERLKNENLSIIEKIFRKICNFRLSNINSYLLAYLPISMLGLKPAKYAFCAVPKSNINLKLVGKSTETVMIHALDYDNYLDSITSSVENTNTIVFLDQNLPLHSDELILPTNNRPTPDVYFPEMCRAFDRIERIFNTKIIICCHPRSNRSQLTDYYNGREVVIGKTNETIRTCKFCIAHFSGSISYAVMYRKPIVFITSDSINKFMLERADAINTYASYFNKRVINISKDFSIDVKMDLYLDDDIYQKYMNNFIKSNNSCNGKYWDVVSEKIKVV